MTAAVLVALGAAIGAPSRWLVDRSVRSRWPSDFPWGTLTVNLGGSFVLGVVLGAAGHVAAGADVALLLGTGFCGAFTTFSTFAFETLRLIEEHERRYAVVNVAVSLLLGCLLASAGWWLGTIVLGLSVSFPS